MKNPILVLTLLFTFIFLSCGDDDGDASSKYPITLNFSEIEEAFELFKDGAKTEVSQEELEVYYNSQVSYVKEELANEFETDYFKFLSDTQVELSEGDEVFTVDYFFKDGYLFVTFEGETFLYGQGDRTELKYRFAALQLIKENGSSGSSNAYEDEGDIDFFPATFENSINFHNFNSIGEIEGDTYLLIHNVSSVFK